MDVKLNPVPHTQVKQHLSQFLKMFQTKLVIDCENRNVI